MSFISNVFQYRGNSLCLDLICANSCNFQSIQRINKGQNVLGVSGWDIFFGVDVCFSKLTCPTWVFGVSEGAMFGLSGSQVVAGRRDGEMECCGYTFCNVSFLIAYCGHFVSSDDIWCCLAFLGGTVFRIDFPLFIWNMILGLSCRWLWCKAHGRFVQHPQPTKHLTANTSFPPTTMCDSNFCHAFAA